MTALKVAAVFWALLLSGAARADSADRALSRLCPHAMGIAPQIEAHARRQLLHPALLVALIAHESGCRESAFSGKGDYGLGQIRVGGSAAHGASVEDLLKPERNIELTARHLAWCLTLCGGPTGLSVYAGNKRCRSTRYSRSVWAKFLSVFHATKGEPVS